MVQSREATDPHLPEVVRALVAAWRSLLAYPPGHPAPTVALENAHYGLREFITAHGPLVLGVGRQGLLTPETTLSSVPAQQFAQALYERSVAILGFEPGVKLSELESLFRLLASDPRERQAPFVYQLAGAGARHLLLQTVDYSSIRVTDEVGDPKTLQPGAKREAAWDRLVRDLLTRTELPAELDDLWTEMLLSVEDSHAIPASATDTGLGGVETLATTRLAPAVQHFLTKERGVGRVLAARRIAELIRELPETVRVAVLDAAVRALATDESAAEALQAFSSPFAPAELLRSLHQLQELGAEVSAHGLRMAQTLAAVAASSGTDSVDTEVAPDSSALVRLYSAEDIDRYNPVDHQALLLRMSIDVPQLARLPAGARNELGNHGETLSEDLLVERLVDALMEMLDRHGLRQGFRALLSRLEDLFLLFLTDGRLGSAARIVERLSDQSEDRGSERELRAELRDSLGRMVRPEVLAALVASLSPPWEESLAAARRVVIPLGRSAIANLLLLLIEEPNRSRRRRIFDLLVSCGSVTAEFAARWLTDSRWYVVRNMIVLLRALEDRTALPLIQRCAYHPDRRVRLEALRSLFTLGGYTPRDILEGAFRDPNVRVAEIAVALTGKYGGVDAIDPLVRLLRASDVFGRRRAVRVRALHALGELGHPSALPHLSRFFRSWLIPVVPTEERRAAFESLHGYTEAARGPWVRRGLRSWDPVIRRICHGLSQA